MAKKQEKTIVLERKYIIPLRSSWMHVPRYKRANKAVKTIREFIARHMKVRDDIKKIKLSKFLNEAVWRRSIKKPPAKIEIKAVKYSTGEVMVEVVKLSKRAEMIMAKEKSEIAKAAVKKSEIEKKQAEQEKEGNAEEEKRAEELKEEERLLQKEKHEVERELIKPRTEVHQRKALEK
ncbi:MAG: 50S ribosomal protein L31e [archaeon]